MSFGFVCFYTLNSLLLVNGFNDGAFGKLCFVSLLFRHGDRAPEGFYPNDPYSDVSHWPNGWGQLTKLGKLQQYELGKWMRHRYWDFLPNRYNASDIYVQSTDVDRTLMSAYCNLAGLYECWVEEDGDGLNWQPIPVHTTPVLMDAVLAAHKKCPAYEHLFQNVKKIDEVCALEDSYKDVYLNLSFHTGLQIKSTTDCIYLYSTLYIQNLHGLQLPEWTKNFFPYPLNQMAEFAFKLPCYNTQMKRLKCGPLVKDIVQHMQDKVDGNMTQKVWMYSCHDSTLVNLMQCLGIFDGEIPPFTSTLIFELFKNGKDYFVSISYKTPTCFRNIKLPSCEKLCPFGEFQKLLRPIIPDDWEKECLKKK